MNTFNGSPELEEGYRLTPCGCLIIICHKYGIRLDRLTQAEIKRFCDDFMDLLRIQGYLSKGEGGDNMSAKPILFNTGMVRTILEGRKYGLRLYSGKQRQADG